MSRVKDRREEEKDDEHSHYRNECSAFFFPVGLSCLEYRQNDELNTVAPSGKCYRCISTDQTHSIFPTPSPSPPMSPHIPPELIDQIIDHLHNDPKSLNACALIARDLFPSARYHRFRSIRFQSAKKLDSFHQFSQIAPGPLPDYQEATICDNSGYVPASILEAAANACLTLPNLERIKFNNRTYASTPRVVTILSPIANKIMTLNLSGTLFASSNDFWPLICSFPNLSAVQACGVTFGSTEETTFFPVNTYEPPITTFCVSTSRQGFVIEHLINPPFPLRFLENFEILYVDPDQTTLVPLAESIHETAKQLRFSAVSIHRADDQSGSYTSPDHLFGSAPTFLTSTGMPDFVGKLTKLETLIMDKIYVLRPGDGPMESLLWIPPALRSITAPIQKLCIELMIKNIDYLDSVDWPQVDHILANQEPLRWLTEVTVTVMSTSAIRRIIDTEALKVFVVQRLPMMHDLPAWHPSLHCWKILGEHHRWVLTTLDIGCTMCVHQQICADKICPAIPTDGQICGRLANRSWSGHISPDRGRFATWG